MFTRDALRNVEIERESQRKEMEDFFYTRRAAGTNRATGLIDANA
jgi:hypothetical protein